MPTLIKRRRARGPHGRRRAVARAASPALGRGDRRRAGDRAAAAVAGARASADAARGDVGVWLAPADDPARSPPTSTLDRDRGRLPEVHRRPRLFAAPACCASATATAASCARSATCCATSSSTWRAAASMPSRCATDAGRRSRARGVRRLHRRATRRRGAHDPGSARRASAPRDAAAMTLAATHRAPRQPRSTTRRADPSPGGARVELRRRGHGAARPHRAATRCRSGSSRSTPGACPRRRYALIDRARERYGLDDRRLRARGGGASRPFVARARRQRVLRQRRAAQALLRDPQDRAAAPARSPASGAWITGLRREQSVTRARARRAASSTPCTACRSSIRSPTGPRTTSGPTCARERRALQRAARPRLSLASAARRARARSSRARTCAPAAGGGRRPSTRNAACT